MHYFTKLIIPLFVIGIFLTTSTAQAEDDTVNRLLASQCAQCNGTNGYAVGDIDSLAGEEAKDMYEDLMDMRGEDNPENISEIAYALCKKIGET
jgi:sulfide dehydrogenase cytochrome subunit